MLSRSQIGIRTDLVCNSLCLDLHRTDFLYYDKDGFELNRAEQKYYSIMGYPLTLCLNHRAFQTDWYTSQHPKLIIDHSLLLYRCRYEGHARQQLEFLKSSVPQTSLLINTQSKWGFDFALDSIDDNNNVYEVLHIEYDTKNLDEFLTTLNNIQQRIDAIDWLDAARRIDRTREQWSCLKGFEQNDWKARYLIAWSKAEFTEKVI